MGLTGMRNTWLFHKLFRKQNLKAVVSSLLSRRRPHPRSPSLQALFFPAPPSLSALVWAETGPLSCHLLPVLLCPSLPSSSSSGLCPLQGPGAQLPGDCLTLLPPPAASSPDSRATGSHSVGHRGATLCPGACSPGHSRRQVRRSQALGGPGASGRQSGRRHTWAGGAGGQPGLLRALTWRSEDPGPAAGVGAASPGPTPRSAALARLLLRRPSSRC